MDVAVGRNWARLPVRTILLGNKNNLAIIKSGLLRAPRSRVASCRSRVSKALTSYSKIELIECCVPCLYGSGIWNDKIDLYVDSPMVSLYPFELRLDWGPYIP